MRVEVDGVLAHNLKEINPDLRSFHAQIVTVLCLFDNFKVLQTSLFVPIRMHR